MSVVAAGGEGGVGRNAALQHLCEALDTLAHCCQVELMEGLETLLVYVKNLIMFPEEKKYRKVKISNIHFQERLGHLPGAQSAMIAIGYGPAGEYLRLDEKLSQQAGRKDSLKELEKEISTRLNQVKGKFMLLPHRLNLEHQFRSVAAAATHSAIGKRADMEDDEVIVDKFCGEENQTFFGLYDGHGGRATVDFVVKVLHMNLESHLKNFPAASLLDAYKFAYIATDGQLRRQNILRSGSTAVTCVVKEENGKRMLYTGNVGDSRAVLSRGGRAIRLTKDHKASLAEEAKRITDAGGFIGRNKRVNGVLAITRALGDHMLKENDVVSAEPYCVATEILPEDTLLLLACDGVWDVMTDQEAVDFVAGRLRAGQEAAAQVRAAGEEPASNLNQVCEAVCKALVREALDRRSLDNVTVMVVVL